MMPFMLLGVALAGCATSTQWAGAAEVASSSARMIRVEAAREGFAPTEIRARVGETITLAIHRTSRDRCLDRVVLHLSGTQRIQRELPFGTTASFTLQLTRAGELGLTCAKDGHAAAIYVEPEVTR
jgi:plastocyanin